MTQPILERIAAGDPTAVQDCVDRYGNLIWSMARRFIANRPDAEDAVQEIFIDLWAKAARYDSTRAPEPAFVAMIARRRLIDRLRKTQREPGIETLAEEYELADATAERELLAQAEMENVARVLTTLRPEQQRVLKLSVYHGYSHGAIAEKLELPLGTVKTHLRRGLLAIREQLGRDGGDEVSTEAAS